MKKRAVLYKRKEKDKVECFLCSHHCIISEGDLGICGVRQNIDGKLYSLVYAEPITTNPDPIEKKPLYHFLPGTLSYSLATIGCNLRCDFCQNARISQISKKDKSHSSILNEREYLPENIVKEAKYKRCKSIAYTYTEPTIFFEYAFDIAKLAKEVGIANIFVTNGYMTKEALDMISPYLDAANVDLKSFSEDFYYRRCKAKLKPVLESITYMYQLGIWIEITTLVIPGENDSEEELHKIADFIANLDKDIPWHISRFFPQYRLMDYPLTPMIILKKAYDIGKEHGLRYIYLGNVGEGEDTYCYNCNKLLIGRDFYTIKEFNIKEGVCAFCGVKIKGVWS